MLVRADINYEKSTRIQDEVAFRTDSVINDCTKILFAHMLHTGNGREDQSLDVDQHF